MTDQPSQEVERLEAAQARVERAQEGRDKALDLAVQYMDLVMEMLKLIPFPLPKCDHEERDPACTPCVYREMIRLAKDRLSE